jgi:hypothetical protein
VVQVRAGGTLSVPVVVTNHTPSTSSVSFEAELPAGWRLESAALGLAPGASEARTLRLHVPARPVPGQLEQIAVRMRHGSTRSTVLETMVRGVAKTDGAIREEFDGPSAWFRPTNENSRATVSDGIGSFTTVGKGFASFETGMLTVDFDKNPQLDFGVHSFGGQFAVKIYEVGRSPYGIYILPSIPVLPGLPVADPVRINLRERTGWSGIHTFRLGLYVVGQEGDTLRLRDWGMTLEE